MPLQPHMKLISVDDHLIEPPDVWQDRLPGRYRDAGPRIIEVGEARNQVWLYQGQQYPTLGLAAVAGRAADQIHNDPTRYEQMIKGAYDPVARVGDMDLAGIQAHLLFPTFPRFAGTLFLEGADRELALLCVRAYNDFLIDEWCATAPDRFIAMALLPLWDPQLAAAELERTVAKGAKCVAFPENPTPLGLPSIHTDHWDPLFAAAQAHDVPLCMHFGTSSLRPPHSPDAPWGVIIALMGANSIFAAVEFVFSPVFQKFPRLNVALSEGGIGWMPYIMERLDDTWARHRYYAGIDSPQPPSQIFREHIHGCFIQDEAGIAMRHTVGVNNIMWEGDYPHSDSLWPNDRKNLEQVLADVPDDEAHRIVELNARDLFHFDADLA
jgi:predicted TIM-barrel fold metal-dependent hydrolase